MDFALVLVACWCLDDEDRRDLLRKQGDALHTAFLTNFAINDPKRLEQAARAHRVALSVSRTPPAALLEAREQLRATGRMMEA